jgi:hypothetical protein
MSSAARPERTKTDDGASVLQGERNSTAVNVHTPVDRAIPEEEQQFRSAVFGNAAEEEPAHHRRAPTHDEARRIMDKKNMLIKDLTS